ncbi:hypothetical protein AB7M46_004815 [Bradyrhizobium elkanii]
MKSAIEVMFCDLASAITRRSSGVHNPTITIGPT